MHLRTLSKLLTAFNLLVECFATPSSLITAAPQLIPRSEEPGENSPSCATFYSLVKSCTAATPGFLTLDPSSQISCVCYSHSSLVPAIYDNAFATCLSYLKTASPTAYTTLGFAKYDTMTAFGRAWESPCAEFASAASVSSQLTDSRIWACSSVYGIIQSCQSATPGFNDLPASSQASCECYLPGGSMYAPAVYDGYFSNCLDYYQTHDSWFYSNTLHGDEVPRTPCAVAGNVRNGTTASGAAASASIPSQTSSRSSVALTTSEPQATARPNQASYHRGWYSWLLPTGMIVLPLLFAVYL